MLYLARVLHMPDGKLQRNKVVRVECGAVKDFYDFAGEIQSMLFVDDVFVSNNDSLKLLADIKEISHQCDGEKLYAYRQDGAGGLQFLE